MRPGITPGVRVGEWSSVLLPLFTALGLALCLLTYRRKQQLAPESEPGEPALVGATEEKASRD